MRTVTQDDADKPTGEGGGSTVRRERGSRRRRTLLSIALVLVIVLSGWQIVRGPGHSPAVYEWTLHFPGTPPGATFKTKPGDDIRRMLDILMVDSGTDWQSPLADQGVIEVRLSYHMPPSFWTAVKWRFGRHNDLQESAVVRTLLTMRVSMLAKSEPRYVVVRIDPEGDEVTTGTFDDFHDVQRNVLDELAQAMSDVQTRTQ